MVTWYRSINNYYLFSLTGLLFCNFNGFLQFLRLLTSTTWIASIVWHCIRELKYFNFMFLMNLLVEKNLKKETGIQIRHTCVRFLFPSTQSLEMFLFTHQSNFLSFHSLATKSYWVENLIMYLFILCIHDTLLLHQ